MKTHTSYLTVSVKKYIHKTWDGIFDFFTQYGGNLVNVQTKTDPGLADADIANVKETTAAYGQLNQAIDEVEKLLAALRALRIQLLTQQNLDPIHVPVIQYLVDLLAAIEGKRGGLLWQEDRLTDRIFRSPRCTQEDFAMLGIVYKPNTSAPIDNLIGKLYAVFDGGKVPIHWTLPRGYHNARLSSSTNHGEWVLLYEGSESHFIDARPIPAISEIRSYKLEIMETGKPIGKPAIDKILVGQDISVEETKL
ncbi:MAG: hypothetical protein LBK71_00495 [Verrucomicrobiales bacterium]|jgi:hypothetical protein|nr:hypothetical protein [Verrucomicrobiales bacterium]